MWRDWFTFSRQDRRAILLLAILIIIALAILYTKPMWHYEKPYEAYSPDSLLQSLDKKPQEKSKREFSQTTLHIPTPTTKRPTTDIHEPETLTDTIRHKHPYADYMKAKYKPGTFVDLNTADTTELMRIPGIGPVRAQRIVAYRRALGGYHSIAQVHEAYDLPEHLGDWVHISAPTVQKLHINKAPLSQLRAHPYLTFYQARAITNLRKREGHIRSVRQLLFLDEFTESDITRLEPYLSFE